MNNKELIRTKLQEDEDFLKAILSVENAAEAKKEDE